MVSTGQPIRDIFGRRITRRRLIQGTALGGAGLAAGVVIGCGDESEPASTPAPSGSGAAVDQPSRGGTIAFVATGSDAPHLDVHRNSFGQLHTSGVGIAYSRMMMFDLTKFPQELAFTGDVAESFETPESTVYTFKLRHGVKWQAVPPLNGRELMASDVVYSYERQISEKVNAGIIGAVDKVEAVDGQTVKVTLKRPDADFLYAIGDTRTKIVAPEAVAVNGSLEQGPTIGTGPWLFDEWVPDQILKMKGNPNNFRQGLPYADEYNQIVLLDVTTQQAAFRTGQVLDAGTNGQITRLLKQSVPDLAVQDAKLLGTGGGDRLWMSPINGPTKDQRVRQALGKLIDRQALIQDVFFGSAWANAGIFVPSFDWHLPEAELNRLLALDIQGAKQLISAAGVDLSSWKPVLDSGVFSATTQGNAELFVSQLKQIGVEATIRPIDKVEITDRVFGRGDTEFCVCNNAPTVGSNGHLYTFFHSSGRGGLLFKQLADKQFDDMIDRQAVILNNPAERKSILQEIQRRNLELAIAIPVVTPNGETALSPKLGGYKHLTAEPTRYENSWLRA